MLFSLKTLVAAVAFSNIVSVGFAHPIEDLTSRDITTSSLEPRVPPVKPKPKPDDPNDPNAPKVPGGNNNGDTNAGPSGNRSPILISDKTGDNVKSGKDTNGVAFVSEFASRVQAKVPLDSRTAVFYTDAGAREQMQNLIEQKMGGKGFSYFNVFGGDGRGGRGGNTDGLIPADAYRTNKPAFFMGIYRGSRAIAQENVGKEVYVILQRNAADNQRRTIFDPVETRATGDSDAQLGVGQVWHDVELPTLMRNPNVERITVIQKVNGQWIQETQWDIKAPNAPGRDSVELRSLDDVTTVPKVPGSKH